MVAVGMHFLLYGSRIGLHLRLVGESEASAGYSGVRAKFVRTLALTISGALAAGVALGEVLGHAGRFRMGFSADYGFIGIAVALLARNQPLAIIATSILFAALHKGAASLDLETENITRDLSVVLQALIILSVSAVGFWSWQRRKK
jgi:simple sugar transport system permease protein